MKNVARLGFCTKNKHFIGGQSGPQNASKCAWAKTSKPGSVLKYTQWVLFLLIWLPAHLQAQPPMVRKTAVSIKGEDFYINGRPSLPGIHYKGMRMEGLLPNVRMVQGIYDDYNPETKGNWVYPDTKVWDPERNTNEFIKAMPTWRAHGLLAFTLNLQGGSPYGYSRTHQQPWLNTAIKPDGSLDERYMNRLERILNRADELGMVVLLGAYYFGQDQNVETEAAVKTGLLNTVNWVLDKGYTNVMIEVNNECDVDSYDHAILKPARIVELIRLAKAQSRNGRTLLVSTSYKGGAIPSDEVLEASDYVLLHGNGVHNPIRIEEMVMKVRANKKYKGTPIVFNEDDHFDFEKPLNNFIASTRHHASWGLFDYRMENEKFEAGYQSIPVDWGISSPRKKGFFDLLKQMTAGSDPSIVQRSTLLETKNDCSARHENSFAKVGKDLVLVGGRGMRPTDLYGLKTMHWSSMATPPLEMHHFQAIAYQNELWVLGAFTGGYPHEKPIPNAYIFNPKTNEWRKGPEIPESRRRGSAGVFVYQDKIYVVGGIIDGHWDGHVSWFDEYDPALGQWKTLPDAPHARDHIQAAMIDDKVYLAGGRRSTARINQVLNLTEAAVDVFDFKTRAWETLPASKNLPTLRAGASCVALGKNLLVIGGESGTQIPAHSEVEMFNTTTQEWSLLATLKQGRHGTGAAVVGKKVYTAAGSLNRGGGPELKTMEVIQQTSSKRK